MPYIKQEDRAALLSEPLINLTPADEGELNYVITTVCQKYLQSKGLRYQHINAVVGALECAKLEAYRRIAANYEDRKIAENKDVMAFPEFRRESPLRPE